MLPCNITQISCLGTFLGEVNALHISQSRSSSGNQCALIGHSSWPVRSCALQLPDEPKSVPGTHMHLSSCKPRNEDHPFFNIRDHEGGFSHSALSYAQGMSPAVAELLNTALQPITV